MTGDQVLVLVGIVLAFLGGAVGWGAQSYIAWRDRKHQRLHARYDELVECYDRVGYWMTVLDNHVSDLHEHFRWGSEHPGHVTSEMWNESTHAYDSLLVHRASVDAIKAAETYQRYTRALLHRADEQGFDSVTDDEITECDKLRREFYVKAGEHLRELWAHRRVTRRLPDRGESVADRT